jgi:hypothetical protein
LDKKYPDRKKVGQRLNAGIINIANSLLYHLPAGKLSGKCRRNLLE